MENSSHEFSSKPYLNFCGSSIPNHFKLLPKTPQFFRTTLSIPPLMHPCMRYSLDTFLIPFCNPTLQKGIRKVSERYQKEAIDKRWGREVNPFTIRQLTPQYSGSIYALLNNHSIIRLLTIRQSTIYDLHSSQQPSFILHPTRNSCNSLPAFAVLSYGRRGGIRFFLNLYPYYDGNPSLKLT